MSKFWMLNIGPYLNNRGFTTEQNVQDGNLSLGGSSLPVEGVPLDREFVYKNIPFHFTYKLEGDNIELEGQTIGFPSQFISKIHVIGVSSNGSLSDYLYLLQNDVVVKKAKVCLSDFVETVPALGDELAINFEYLHTQVGRNDFYRPNLWYYCVDLEKTYFINGIRLEDNPFMHIFAVTFESEKELTDC
ncbi:hypothetical protein [Brevibacillus sp. SAFN-007a]|uniref:hypothetical protein n=1 Tax=Brevibacillus sp. SAFN-007a TaxID=3436862 RepID=UPI003F81BFE2